jgi:hypothetical protein
MLGRVEGFGAGRGFYLVCWRGEYIESIFPPLSVSLSASLCLPVSLWCIGVCRAGEKRFFKVQDPGSRVHGSGFVVQT